ncbi:MAG: sigma 54-dependent Fis family transcriptional regulator [Polyangiaceae bacterium]
MTQKKTAAVKMPAAMPVHTVLARVLDGPDKGAAWEGDRGSIGSAKDNALTLGDPTVSGYHVELIAEKSGIRVADLGSTNGTFAGDTKLEHAVVPPGTTLRLGRSVVSLSAGEPTTVELHDEDRLGDLFGRTRKIRRLMQDVRRVAPSQVAVLLVGESGTGKELVARAIHDQSTRASGPFVTIDCGSLTPSLVASELFGHEQGAFTGATRTRRGAFEHASGGTLFLDEIGELPAELQTTLLGALERRRFTRVGGHEEISVDVRVVAATNRDLRNEVNAGSFRLDLYYRLAVVTLEVAPLRERSEDIPLLVARFLELEGFSGDVESLIPPETLAALQRHHWPGNVRELRNFVQGTLAMGEPLPLREHGGAPDGGEVARVFARFAELPYGEARSRLLADFEAHYLEQLLERNQGNVARAARAAEMARSHLNDLLRRHKLR